jgi:hypothetical protein
LGNKTKYNEEVAKINKSEKTSRRRAKKLDENCIRKGSK